MKTMLLLITIFSFLKADFISKLEYGEMLYDNPRGISCKKCHGDNGKGRLIASFAKKEKNIEIIAPDIKNISVKKLTKGLENGKSVMPVYKLTDEEINALYIFLNAR